MSEYGNLIQQSFGRANPALPPVVGNIAEDPERAARAIDLAKVTGVSSTAIFGDLDEFERQNKAMVASDIVANNQHLSDWVQADPIRPKIANDDYGNMDAVSQSVSALDLPMKVLRAPEALAKLLFPDPLHRFTEGGPLGSWILKDDNIRQNYPLMGSVAAALGTPVELFFRGVGGVQNTLADAVVNAVDALGQPQLARDLGGMVEWAGMTGRTPTSHPIIDTYKRARPYLEQGREPPPTILPEYDQFRAERNAKDVEGVTQAMQEAQASTVRERAPELYREFIDRHTDAEIGISPDLIAALYGEKLPEPNDGILGWAPGIQEKIANALRSGDDVMIPLADWVTYADPKLMQALGPGMRVRPGGITALETEMAKAAEVPQPLPIPEEVPTARNAAGLEPLYSIGDRKLQLARMEQAKKTPEQFAADAGFDWNDITEVDRRFYTTQSLMQPQSKFGPEQGFHDFHLVDETGNKVGYINLSTQDGGKTLYVDMVSGVNGLGPRDFGPALMRDLLRQIKAEFPEAEKLTGHRVSGAREKAQSFMEDSATPEIKLSEFDLNDPRVVIRATEDMYKVMQGAKNFGLGIKARLMSPEHQAELIKAVDSVIERIVPQGVRALGVKEILAKDRPIEGVYLPYSNRTPVLLWTFDHPDVVLHEAIHHLRNAGFFTEAEWGTLTKAAADNDWIKQHGIDQRYSTLTPERQLEEAIAESYRYWQAPKGEFSPLDRIYAKIKTLFDGIKDKVKEIFGLDHEPTWEEIFGRVDTGEVGSRQGVQRLDTKEAIPSEKGDRIFERAKALNMSIERFQAYDKAMQKRHEEDIAKATARAEREQTKRQSKEWKDNRATLRAEVAQDINLRPDIAADNYFADGILYGEKVERIKLGTDFLTDEQKAALPRDYYNKAGAHPDDLAPLFGYPDGASLVQNLSLLSATRRTSGMRPIDFKRRLIDIETDRQMELRYGKLEENIVDAVKEQVASETQIDILHEQTMKIGMEVGEAPLTREQIVGAVDEAHQQTKMSNVSSDRLMQAAGRAGKAIELGLLKLDPAEAFKMAQRQEYATIEAKMAMETEAKLEKFEKLVSRLAKREVKPVEPEYLDFIHGLLQDAGVPVKRTPEEIALSKEHYGHESLASFVEDKRSEGYFDGVIADSVLDGSLKGKRIEDMTVAEFNEFNDAIVSLNHVGREVRTLEIAGEKRDFDEFRREVIRNIQTLPARARESQGRWIYNVDASLTRMEELVKDLDLRKEMGPLFEAVIVPMAHSKAKEFDLLTALSKHFSETRGDFGKDWKRSLAQTIEQDVLHDPYTQTPYDMTKENLIQVMLNWGNRSNIAKFVRGAGMAKFGKRLKGDEFALYEAQIKALIDKHATEQDWQFVQRMWEPFKEWQPMMDTVSRNTSGVTPKWIKGDAFDTPFGKIDGGYWPVKYDRLGSSLSVIEDKVHATDGVFGKEYFRAATSKGYLKERTGHVDFVDISTSLEQAAGAMQQTIHDIAFRDSLIQGAKVFYDKQIRAAIRKHYGQEYEAQLVPWLRRIAHQYTADDSALKGFNDFMRRTRVNLVGHTLPLNLKVILSPDIGVPDPVAWTRYIANRSDNMKLAMEKSDEIRHMVYNLDRDFREQLDKITLNPNTRDIQMKAVQWGFIPVAKVSQEFRVSTFVDQYNKALARGRTEGEAAMIADSFVRERHGAASVIDLPAAMQGNEGIKMLTMFYGFFNTMYNWQRQLPGNLRRGEYGKFMENGLGSVVVGAAFGALLFNQRKQDDSWWKIVGKALLLQPLSTVPIINQTASFYFEGFSPRMPYASLLSAAGSIISDSKKWWKGDRVEKPITHAANVVGLSTGLPLAQLGRTTQFGVDVARGRQRPKTMADWARGIITGEAQLKR